MRNTGLGVDSPSKSLASVEVPKLGGTVVRGRHGEAVVHRVALQDVHLSLVPHQALHLQPCVAVPYPDGVVTHRGNHLCSTDEPAVSGLN